MNADEIRRAVAELDGWKQVHWHNSRDLIGIPPSKIRYEVALIGGSNEFGFVPDYPNDLNAIMPLLPVGVCVERRSLAWVVGYKNTWANGKDLALTACEFFLRVKGKWKE